MVSETLIIKHFPRSLSSDDKIKFLEQCGAVNVRIVGSSSQKSSIVFARFPSISHAKTALNHLHQLEVMGSYLVVEYSRDKVASCVVGDAGTRVKHLKETVTETLLKKFLDKLNNWVGGVELRTRVPSHLRYHYPPPTTTTLRNISQQLASTPRLYTQVLHLMNKMNLPCPIAPDPPVAIPLSTPTYIDKTGESKYPAPIASSESESEISSEDEKVREIIPEIKPKPKKIVKRPKIIKPIKAQSVAKAKKSTFDEVFEDPISLVNQSKSNPKKLRLMDSVSAQSATEKISGFGFIHPVVQAEGHEEVKGPPDVRNEMEEERLEREKIDCITLETLAANRISEKDRTMLPAFKNYAEGAPTCRLYIKNLAKQTTADDLKFIFSAFLTDKTEDTPNIFDVRLMQEGRMKGQAFITLQTVQLAQTALAQTNGYILHDKPMVIQFARSAVK